MKVVQGVVFTLLVFSAGVVVTSQKFNLEAVTEGPCVDQDTFPIVDDDWVSDFAAENILFVPLMSRYAAFKMSHLLLNRPMNADINYETFCPTVLTVDNTTRTLYGYENQATDMSFSGEDVNVEMTIGGAQEQKARVHVTWSDYKTYFVSVQCWEDGQKDWVLYSMNQTVTCNKMRKSILEHVTYLGFDPDKFIQPTYWHHKFDDPFGSYYDETKGFGPRVRSGWFQPINGHPFSQSEISPKMTTVLTIV